MSEFFINLVFDNFDEDGNPIPNGSHIQKLGASLPNWFVNHSDIKAKFYHINDVTEDDTFYYIINYGRDLKDVIYDTFILSDEAIDCCKDKNLKILFINFHEVNNNEFEVLQQFNKYISDFSLNETNFYYINNNTKLKEYINILNTKINVYTSTFIFELIASKLNRNESVFKPNKEFLFSCHNRATRKHRIETLCFLKKYNILKNTDWTYVDPELRIKDFQPGNLTGYFTFVADEINYFKEIGLKYSKYETHKTNWLEIESGAKIIDKISEECFTNCYINIITETFFDSPEIHASEKSFRAFYFMQLPIFVATYGHVQYLRKRFGFDMFDDLIDHSYDLEKDSQKRMKMVFEEIKRLNDNKTSVISFYKKNKDRFKKNLDLFQEVYKKEETINFFKTLSNKITNDADDIVIDKINENSHFKGGGIKIYHDIIVPNKCGTRYITEYLLLNTKSEFHNNYYNNSIHIKYVWDFPYLNWIVIRHPQEYLKSALKTDLLNLWSESNKNDIDESILINKYISEGTNHYFNNLYKTFYSYALNYTNVNFVNLKDLSDFFAHKFPNKTNYEYDSTKYGMLGKYYMDEETILDYVKEFYPLQWDIIQLNLKKEMFFYNKIVEKCNFFNKIKHPPIQIPITIIETIEKNSWLKKIV
jgi:hypothetical protein